MADISKIQVDEIYNVKDTKARTEKINKYVDDEATAVINFVNGILINGASITYNPSTNTVTFL